MQDYVALQEERRTSRRTVADALELVRQKLGVNEIARAEIRIGRFQLPSGQCTAMVQVLFPDLGCRVSLPSAARFRARSGMSSQHKLFEISRLDRAEVGSDGSVVLADRSRLRAVEVVPTHLPYEVSELEERVLRHVISLTKSYYCYRSIQEGLPEHLQHQVPDLRALDYSRVRTIQQAPPLRVIQAFIEDNDPERKVSNQKIADALATFGVRVPRRRPRTASKRAMPLATI
jgi:hypothetical protein